MKPVFGALVLIFILFLNEIETSDYLNLIESKKTSTSKKEDFESRMESRRISCLGTPKRRRSSYQSIHAQFQHVADPTGVNAYNLFLQHYSKNNLPPPEAGHEALELYERHANGLHRYNQWKHTSKRNLKAARQEAHRIYHQPFVQQHKVQNSPSRRLDIQQLPSQSNPSDSTAHTYLRNQYVDQPRGSGSVRNLPSTNPQKSLADVPNNLNKQYDIQCPQPPHHGDGSGSGNNHPYTNSPMSPADDLCKQFDIQSPQYLDFKENRSQIKLTASVAIDNYHVYLSRKYQGQSGGSGSG